MTAVPTSTAGPSRPAATGDPAGATTSSGRPSTRSVAAAPVTVHPPIRVAWEQAYRADPLALPSQSPQWVDALEATGRWRDASRLYRTADGRELVLPLVTRRHLGRVGGPELSMPDAWGFGGLVGPDVRAEDVAAVLADLATVRTAWIRIRPNPLLADAWHEGAGAAGRSFELAKRAHVLRLGDDPDEVFATSFASSARRAVRSATKAGLTVEHDTSGRLLPIFHQLLLCSVERWAGSQHEPLALARFRAARRDPLAKFTAWSDALDGGCNVLVARRDEQPIAAMIVLQGHNAHMTRSAMDREAVGNDRPNELLMWHAIRHAVESGCGWFHLGESGSSTSLSRYKEKFGAVGHDYAEHRIERVPATAVDARARGAVKRLIGFRDR